MENNLIKSTNNKKQERRRSMEAIYVKPVFDSCEKYGSYSASSDTFIVSTIVGAITGGVTGAITGTIVADSIPGPAVPG